ncbi:MAG: aminotransferase class V-fold PLP-dependent enzyme [bacterium]
MDSKHWEQYRTHFPVTEQHVYFQHPAVTALPSPARVAMHNVIDDMVENGCLNESSWVQQIESVRSSASKIVGAPMERLGFVKNTSHGLSTLASSFPWEDGDNAVIPEGEFPANVYPWMNQTTVKRVPLGDDGGIYLDNIKQTVDNSTRVLSLSSVQYHNGFRAELKVIGQFCNEHNIYFVVDGIQSLGWDPIQADNLPIHALVADGHKWLCGPEGVGVMYLDKSFQNQLEWTNIGWKSVINPFTFHEEQFELRGSADVIEEGSSNTIGTYGLGASLDILLDAEIQNIRKRNLELTKYACDELREAGFRILRDRWDSHQHSPILVIEHPEVSSEQIHAQAQKHDIQLSVRAGRIRLGFHFFNNKTDIDKLMEALGKILYND